MGLPTEILNFFKISNATIKNNRSAPYSLSDFCKGKNDIDILEIRTICQKFEHEGLLVHAGIKNNSPLAGDCYYNFTFDNDLANYGSYDFLINGFLSIRNHFIKSVRPVILKDNQNKDDIGTCFVIGGNTIVTALHCIENMECVTITDQDDNFVKAKQIWTSIDKQKDIAIIELEGNPFLKIPLFKIGNGKILDQVLTMGYPPISGFDSILFAEIATINTSIKSSTGNIVGKDKSYLDNQNYLLINAKVKGGNSGGPIVDKYGHAIGMLTHIPTDPFDNKKLDFLGYGIGISGEEILKLLEQSQGNKNNIKAVDFQNIDNGFKTSK